MNEGADYNNQDVSTLIKLVIDLNLTMPVSYDNKINSKLNAIESQLKKMGINPRKR